MRSRSPRDRGPLPAGHTISHRQWLRPREQPEGAHRKATADPRRPGTQGAKARSGRWSGRTSSPVTAPAPNRARKRSSSCRPRSATRPSSRSSGRPASGIRSLTDRASARTGAGRSRRCSRSRSRSSSRPASRSARASPREKRLGGRTAWSTASPAAGRRAVGRAGSRRARAPGGVPGRADPRPRRSRPQLQPPLVGGRGVKDGGDRGRRRAAGPASRESPPHPPGEAGTWQRQQLAEPAQAGVVQAPARPLVQR